MTTATHTTSFPTTILYNVTEDEFGYRLGWERGYAAGDTLEEVFSYGDWDANPDKVYDDKTIATALHEAFDLCNILDDPYYAQHPAHHTARQFRLRGVRSMCKGDAVKLGERTFVADRFGWSELHADGTTTKFL